jgi:hypothetical protein
MKRRGRVGQERAEEILKAEAPNNCTILLTMRCPAQCRHCLFESGPTRTETIDAGLGERYIDAIARFDPRPSVSFSGGDPFVQLPLLRRLVARCHSHDMTSEAITSAAWCKTEAYALEVLASLNADGLATICISVDRYHTEFVAAERLRNGIVAGLATGLRVVINSIRDPNSDEPTEAYLERTLRMAPSELEEANLSEIYLCPVGRTLDQVSIDDLFIRDVPVHEPCIYSTDVVTLTPHGALYPCCGMVLGKFPGKTPLFEYDNLMGKSVEEIHEAITALRENLFFRLLQIVGPYKLLDEVRHRNPEIPTRENYYGACDVCIEFTSNVRLQQGLDSLLEEYQERLKA